MSKAQVQNERSENLTADGALDYLALVIPEAAGSSYFECPVWKTLQSFGDRSLDEEVVVESLGNARGTIRELVVFLITGMLSDFRTQLEVGSRPDPETWEAIPLSEEDVEEWGGMVELLGQYLDELKQEVQCLESLKSDLPKDVDDFLGKYFIIKSIESRKIADVIFPVALVRKLVKIILDFLRKNPRVKIEGDEVTFSVVDCVGGQDLEIIDGKLYRAVNINVIVPVEEDNAGNGEMVISGLAFWIPFENVRMKVEGPVQ